MKSKVNVRIQAASPAWGQQLEFGLLYKCPLDADPKGKFGAKLTLTNGIALRVTGADQKFEVGFYSGDHLCPGVSGSIGCSGACKMWNISNFRPGFEISFTDPEFGELLVNTYRRYRRTKNL
jgi:hypothetical protein